MRILMLAAASSVHVVRWANALLERGHEVHLASQHPPENGLSDQVVMHLLPHFGGAGYLLNGGRMKRLVASIKPDLLNVHYATGYGVLSRSIAGVPIVLNVYGSDIFLFPGKSRWHRSLLERNLRHASIIVSSSAIMGRKVKELAGTDLPVTVVPFGVDTGSFRPIEDPSSQDDPFVIGTVKTLAPVYGIDVLIEAFKLVVHDLPQVHVVLRIVGSGPQENALRQLATHPSIRNKVEFLRAIPHDQVPQALNRIDVFCALSRSESFGVAVIEASACGLPVIVSDVGGLPEVVEQGVTGMIVPPEDPKAAAEAIKALVLSSDLRERMGRAGRALVMRKFAWQDCVDRMIEVFNEAIGTGHR